MTLKILGRKSSCNVQKVVWFCKEANIPFYNTIYGGVDMEVQKMTILNH